MDVFLFFPGMTVQERQDSLLSGSVSLCQSAVYKRISKRCLIALQTGVNGRGSKHWLGRNRALVGMLSVAVCNAGGHTAVFP